MKTILNPLPFTLLAFFFLASFAPFAARASTKIEIHLETRDLNRKDRVVLIVPEGFDPHSNAPHPLLLALHGSNSNIGQIRAHLGLGRFADRHGFLVLIPNGTKDSHKSRFWNATPECCDYEHRNPDDSGYLQELVQFVQNKFHADKTRTYVLGHSNGAYMAQRLACDTNGLFAGVVSIAGANFYDTRLCKTHTPIKFLEIHGTRDTEVPYEGDHETASALETTKFWANLNGCSEEESKPASHRLLTFAYDFTGGGTFGLPRIDRSQCENLLCINTHPDTDETRFKNCQPNSEAALWTLLGHGHVPFFAGGPVVDEIVSFLEQK